MLSKALVHHTMPVAEPSRGMKFDTSFAFGLHIRELFAGWGVITQEAQSVGIKVAPPVELYDDPDKRTGVKEENDLREPAVRARI